MANIGQLLVELGVNTAAFKSGLDKATFQAKEFASKLKESFGELGNSIRELGNEFGGIGGNIGNALGSITNVLGPLTESLGSAGGAAAGIVVALGAAGVAAIGAAVHFSETAARIGDLSEATGIGVESLSLLADVASTKGIQVDSMAKALERMDKSALAAAQGGPKTASAYKDLGIAVVDASGHMREAQDIFDDVATKFASMPDGPQKTAEAIKIFGRAGAEMIPLLNEGGAKLKEVGDHFKALNAVISGPTAEASVQLKENMTLMGAAFTGIENQLTSDLVPALNVVATSFVEFFENNQTEIKAFADGLASIAKVVLNVFQEVGLIFSLIYRAFYTAVDELQVFGATVATVYGDVKAHKWGSIWDDIKAGGKTASDEFKYNWDLAVKSVMDTFGNMAKVEDARLPSEKKKNKEQQTDLGKGADLTFMDKISDALSRQASKEEELANQTGKVTEASIAAKAAAEARAAIEKIQDEAADKGIQNTQAYRDKLVQVTAAIKEAATWTATFQAVIASTDAFNKFDDNIKKQIVSLNGQGESLTAADREFAKQDATLTPLRANVEQLWRQYELLAKTHEINSGKMKSLTADIVRQQDALQKAEDEVKAYDAAWVKAQFSKELEKITADTAALALENNALVSANPYGKMEAALEKYITTNKIAVDEANKLRAALAAQEAETAKGAALKTAQGLGFDPAKLKEYQLQLGALQGLWKAGTISEQEYEKTQAQIIKEIADLQAKTGNYLAGIKAGFADFNASTETWGATMQKVVDQGLKGIVDNFAQMVATGKASWASLIASMEQMLLKSAIQSLLNSIFKSLGNALGGSSNGFLSSLGGLFGGGKAIGGDVTPGKAYLVGEKGPELFSPGSAGTIIPNGAGAGGGQVINQQFNISTPNADSFNRSSKQISSQMYRDAAYAHQRMRQ